MGEDRKGRGISYILPLSVALPECYLVSANPGKRLTVEAGDRG
jgi:hypothetical protein